MAACGTHPWALTCMLSTCRTHKAKPELCCFPVLSVDSNALGMPRLKPPPLCAFKYNFAIDDY